VIDAKVALEEKMDESTHEEPKEGELVGETFDGGFASLVGQDHGAEGDGAEAAEEHDQGVLHGVRVGDVVVQHEVPGIVWVGDPIDYWCRLCCGYHG